MVVLVLWKISHEENSILKKKARPESFIRPPKYPGGKKALDEFIQLNLKYPEEALSRHVEGSVIVDFDVDALGAVTKAKVRNGIGYGCDEEALRLVKSFHYEKKKYRGVKVTFHNTIRIHFRLPQTAQSSKQPEIIVNYEVIARKMGDKKGATISYTIIPDK